MAKKQNPYQLWLGLNPKLTNPNLFQLLGVDPRSQDEAAIKQKAVTSAKTLLQKLKAVQPKNDAEKVFKQKLHKKIVLAHETMIASDKRKQYLDALVANAAAQKKAGATPGSALANPAAQNQPAPNTPIVPGPPAPPPPSNPAGDPPAEIPSAIPMAMPVSSTPAASNGTEDASAFSMDDAQGGNSGPNFDHLDAEPQVKVYSKKRKTSRSWVVPIVVLTLLVGGVGGLISMMTKYSNIFELVPALEEKINAGANDPKPTEAITSVEPTLRVPETENRAVEDSGDEDDDMRTSEGGISPQVEPENKGSMAKPPAQPTIEPEAEGVENKALETDESDPDIKDLEDSSREPRTLQDSRLNSIRLGLHRSRDALFRQDRALAKHFNGDVKDLLKRYKIADADAITPKQQGLIRAVKTNDQVIGWVDDFWKQVKSSSIETAGGESITLGDKTMGLVEANEEGVVLRVAGQNERIRYSNLTPLLAITLGEKGSKESVPRWNLAQAAYLGVMAEQNDQLKQQQYRILNQVKMDGFDIEAQAISDFTEPDWLELGLPKEKLEPFSDDQFEELIAKSRKQIGYEDPSSLPMKRVDELIYKLTLNYRKDPAQRVARLWEAIEFIKKGNRVWDLMYVNCELNRCCTEVDFNKSFVDPILQMAKEAKDPGMQDQIARQSVSFVRQFNGNPNLTAAMREKLVSTVAKIAKDLNSGQLAAMAEQLLPASK